MPNTAVDPASTSIGSISIHLMVSLTDRIAPQLTHGNAERSSKLRPPLQLLVDAGTLRALLHKEAGKQLRFSSSSIFVVLGLLHSTQHTGSRLHDLRRCDDNYLLTLGTIRTELSCAPPPAQIASWPHPNK